MVSPPGTGLFKKAGSATIVDLNMLVDIIAARGLFKKAGAATIVDLNMLADIIADLPDADINISASKPDTA